jgi:ATP-binding cassette, subfamily B, bacterial CvaB/MchF/RaxB
MTVGLVNFTGRGRLPIIQQTEAAECGLACLAMIASYHGYRIDLNTLRRRHPISLQGVTLRALIEVATHLNLACRPVRFELSHLCQLHLPAIVHWDMNHFVVLKSATTAGIVVHDPACGQKFFSISEASKHLTGVALELSPSESFLVKDERARLPFSIFWNHIHGNTHALVQIFILSAILEAFVVVSPFYLQLTIDEVIAKRDADLLVVLALGFVLLTAIKIAANTIRSLIMVIVQNALHFQIGARLFRHLVRLPTAYFEKRHIGDILSRFTSIEPIRNALAEGMIAAAIDGLMAIATLAMIFLYSTQLAFVVLTAFVLYAIVRLGLYRVFRERNQAVIETRAQESSTLIETVRAIQSLKLFNRETERESLWLNRYAAVVNTNVSLGRTRISFTTIKEVIFGLESIITIYLAARLALSNSLTIGMIFAFMSYKQQFTEKAALLVEKALDFRILELHLERLADVALTPLEHGHDRPLAYTRKIHGHIELRHVSFRYAETEPFVLEDINLTVEAGHSVTIMGPSGGGKTTLVKIMLGLLEPTSGEVLIDGIPLLTLGYKTYREQIGAVMQEDTLLSGSIADNISFFDSSFDSERMIRCAQLADIHEEIMAMPMTYNTLIGDMGSSLSGGQKQRVLLARALYHQPRMLFLDEGTAHLDIDCEQRINEILKHLRMTRISVAHRPMDGRDRVVRIAKTLEWQEREPALSAIAEHSSGRREPQQHTEVPAGLSQRSDDLYLGPIRHETFCDDEHSGAVRVKPKKKSISYSVRSAHKETMNNDVPYVWRKNYSNNGTWPEKVLQTAHEKARQCLNRAAASSTRCCGNVDDGAV